MNDSWSYSNKGTKAFIKWLIRNYATIAIRTADNELAAHMIEKENGLLGILYVDPKHRRKGLGQLTVSELAHNIKKTRESVCVYANNEASYRLHVSCGFRKVAEILMYKIYPE